MAFEEFSGELDAPVKGAAFVPFDGKLDAPGKAASPASASSVPEREVDYGNPQGFGASEILDMPVTKGGMPSVLQRDGGAMPAKPFDAAEAERLSNRAYAENTRQPGAPVQNRPVAKPTSGQVGPDINTERGARFADSNPVLRAGLKATAGGAQGLGGIVRAVGDFTGLSDVSRFGDAAAGGASKFEAGMGTSGPVEGFGPKSPVPYLKDMAEGAGSSLAQSATLAAMFGPAGVIPAMSVMTAGQEYQQARDQGLDPAMALAGAVPKGIFEAVGEKFTGLDKVAGAMGTLLNKGASDMAKRTAGEVLLRAGIREIPGEVITYLGQTGTDLIPGIGLKQDLTMKDFVDGLRDTVVQAGMMGGAMGGGGHAAQVSHASGKPIASAEDLIRTHWGDAFVSKPKVDPIAEIGKAENVDQAIAAAQAAVQSSTAVDNIANILAQQKSNQSTAIDIQAQPAIENIAGLTPDAAAAKTIAELEAPDANQIPQGPVAQAATTAAPDAIPAGAAAGNAIEPAANSLVLEAVRAEPGAGALDQRLIPVSKRAAAQKAAQNIPEIIPSVANVQNPAPRAEAKISEAAPAKAPEAGARAGVQPAAAGAAPGNTAVQTPRVDQRLVPLSKRVKLDAEQEQSVAANGESSFSDDPARWKYETEKRAKNPGKVVFKGAKFSIEHSPVDPSNPYGMDVFKAVDAGGKVIGTLDVALQDGKKAKGVIQVAPQNRRTGVASSLYKHAENTLDVTFSPDTPHTKAAAALWAQPNREFGRGAIDSGILPPENSGNEKRTNGDTRAAESDARTTRPSRGDRLGAADRVQLHPGKPGSRERTSVRGRDSVRNDDVSDAAGRYENQDSTATSETVEPANETIQNRSGDKPASAATTSTTTGNSANSSGNMDGANQAVLGNRQDVRQPGNPKNNVERAPAARSPQGKQVSFYPGKYGKGMGKEAAKLEAQRLNRVSTDKTVTYAAEEHNDPKLENSYAVVGRKAVLQQKQATAQSERAQAATETIADKPASASEAGPQFSRAAPEAAKESTPAQQATEILDAAAVTGKDRIDALKDVKAGTITPEELKAAYPAKADIRFSRAAPDAERNALDALSRTDDLFSLPKSDKDTVEGITADNDPAISVKKAADEAGRTVYTFTMPDGKTATMSVRAFNPYATEEAPTLYGYEMVDGYPTGMVVERPGTNPEDVGPVDDVWIDVSRLKTGGQGAKIYNIAATYAHNTGKKFIGDPAGLTDEALRRRTEQMLSSALKFGTTEHLAPHPRQIQGDADLGVPPLKWTYGDDLGNIRSLIQTSLGTYSNVNPITFEPSTGRFLDSEGNELDRDAIRQISRVGSGREAGAGSSTLQRNAVLDALVRQEGGTGGGRGQGAGLLERLVATALQSGASTRGIFYAREAASNEPAAPAAVRNPSTVERVQAAVAELIGGKQLPNKLGRVVATTASEIKSRWQPIIGQNVQLGSEGEAGVAQAFYDPATKTVFLIADHIPQGDEKAVAAHELMHKHGQTVLGAEGWEKLHGVINTWANAESDSDERAVYNYARSRVEAVGENLSSQEMFPYAVEAAIKMGVKPSLIAKKGTVARWLGSVKYAMQQAWEKITGKPETFKTQDLVDLAFGIAQMENPESAAAMGRITDAPVKTDSPEFRKWFGDSKVVDDAGKPLVVYHGTPRGDISEFSNEAPRNVMAFGDAQGHYFTSDPAVASNYGEGKYGGKNAGAPAVIPAYLSLQNPKIVETNSFEHTYVSPAGRKKLEADGFDGLIYRDKDSRQNDEYIAFRPEQIKSATGNNGNFDGTKGDIRFSRTTTPSSTTAATPAAALNPWRDETGRLQFAPGQWLYNQLGKAAGPVLVRLGMKAATPELRRQLRQMKIDVEKAQETAVAIARETTKLSEAERAMVSDLVEKELKAGVIPPSHAVRLAAMISDAMNSQTDQLVDLGMLTKDSAEKWRGKYLPRFYESKLQDKLGNAWADAVRRLTGKASVMKGIKGKHLKGRGLYETIPEAQLADYEALGWEVRDPDYQPSLKMTDDAPVPKGMTRIYHGSATPGRYNGKAWFSTDRKYAANYRTDAELQYVDYPTDKLNAIADPDGYGQTVEKGFTVNLELDSAETGLRKPVGGAGGSIDGTVQVWRDFSPTERENMGEIRDAGFRFVMGYMQTQRDIALGKMFERMAQDPEQSSRLEKPGYVQVPTTTVSGTGAKVYGKLAGRWVPAETLSQLSNIEESTSEAWQMYRKALAIWKEGKTVLNPVSHVNNMVSNLTMAHLAGIPYHRGDKYIAAARDFIKKTGYIQEAKDKGLFLGTMSDSELMNTMPEELKILAQKQESTTSKVARTGFNIMTMFLRKPMGAAYQAEDTFFRYLIYKDARERGTPPQDAVDYAQKFIFTYDDLPKGARRIRDFGIPFFSYTYKAAPALLHTALTHPIRMAGPAAVLWGINAAAYAIAAGDDDDSWMDALQKYLTDPEFRAKTKEKEKLEREHLPPWMKGTTSLLTPKTIRLGTDELTKLPLFIDISRIIPGGDLFDVSPNAGGIPLPQPITPSHPLFTTAVAMLGNKDLFRGNDLVDKNDTRGEATEKRLAWLWTQLAPAVAAGSYHWQRGMNALAQANGGEVKWMPDILGGDATGIGKDGLPVQPKYAAMQTFGIKVRPIDLETAEAMERNLSKKMIRDIDAEMRSLNRLAGKGAVSDRAVDKARDLANTKKDRLRDGLTVDGGEKD